MDGQTIVGLVDPTHGSHAVSRGYLDRHITSLRIRIDEGPATGVLKEITLDSETSPTKIIVDLPIEFPATSRKRIRNVVDVADDEDYDYDAVNKRYVDLKIAIADHITVDSTNGTLDVGMGIDFGTNKQRIKNVADPVESYDAVNKKTRTRKLPDKDQPFEIQRVTRNRLGAIRVSKLRDIRDMGQQHIINILLGNIFYSD